MLGQLENSGSCAYFLQCLLCTAGDLQMLAEQLMLSGMISSQAVTISQCGQLPLTKMSKQQ